MKRLLATVISVFSVNSIALENIQLKDYKFLQEMNNDSYFPNHLVDKGKNILIELCQQIEKEKPKGNDVYRLTHAATERFNDLNKEFGDNGSEIETVARDSIGGNVEFILQTYGYDVDIEEAIAPRDW
ncbi:DUF5713 family protein [Thalassolituus sp.]|uniref:DUF5713 family protein n=1 Tax=Thalassolituus sp. TaxID=2030822 RepID=UPI003517E958